MTYVSVIGAGAWGTALSLAALRAGRPVTLLSICDDKGVPFASPHDNIRYAQTIPHCPPLHLTTDAKETQNAEMVIFAPPAQHMRRTCSLFQGVLRPHTPLIIASKGIENTSALLMSEVMRDFFPDNPILVLSGPSFAEDVSKNLPTAVVLAAETMETSQKLANSLRSSCFHLYPSDDLIGAQLGGAIKNIIAIACGIVEGLGFGDNTRAATLAQGLSETARLGQKMGAKLETFVGLAGVGDITLTSFSAQSRNKSFGYALGQGRSFAELLSVKHNLTEGVHTVVGALQLAKKYHLEMPITHALYRVLYDGAERESFLAALFPEEKQ